MDLHLIVMKETTPLMKANGTTITTTTTATTTTTNNDTNTTTQIDAKTHIIFI